MQTDTPSDRIRLYATVARAQQIASPDTTSSPALPSVQSSMVTRMDQLLRDQRRTDMEENEWRLTR